MSISLTELLINRSRNFFHLLRTHFRTGIEHLPGYRLLPTGNTSKCHFQRLVAADTMVDLDQPPPARQNIDEHIFQFIVRCMLDRFLFDRDLFFYFLPNLFFLHPQSYRRKTHMCRKSCILFHGSSSFPKYDFVQTLILDLELLPTFFNDL